MWKFHFKVLEITRLYKGRDKDFLSKFVNCGLLIHLTDDEQESIVKIMEQRLANQNNQ